MPKGIYIRKNGNRLCKVAGCFNRVDCHDLCAKHNYRLKNWGNLNVPKEIIRPKCIIEGCNRVVRTSKICSKHRYLYKKYGFIPDRIKYDPNEIIIKKDYALIVLYDINCKRIAETKIDLEDIYKVKGIKISLSETGLRRVKYATFHKGRRTYRLHRYILGYTGKLVIDHINGDTLDNRKKNLRIVTQRVNSTNCKIGKNNKSGYTGVSYDRGKNRWVAQIMVNGKSIFLGSFISKEEAIKERKIMENELGYITRLT